MWGAILVGKKVLIIRLQNSNIEIRLVGRVDGDAAAASAGGVGGEEAREVVKAVLCRRRRRSRVAAAASALASVIQLKWRSSVASWPD